MGPLLFRSEKNIFGICFERLCKESFEDLQREIENFKRVLLCPTKWHPFKVYGKLYASPILIANIVKWRVSALRRFPATGSPYKLMKNAFCFVLKSRFVLNSQDL